LTFPSDAYFIAALLFQAFQYPPKQRVKKVELFEQRYSGDVFTIRNQNIGEGKLLKLLHSQTFSNCEA